MTDLPNVSVSDPASGITDKNNSYPSSEGTVPEKPYHAGQEHILAAVIAFISFGFVQSAFSIPDLITTILYCIFFTAIIVYFRKKGHALSGLCKKLAVILYAFSTVFFITDNNFIKILNILFLSVATGYFVYAVSHDKRESERFLPFTLIKALFEYPLSKFDVLFRITGDCASKSKFAVKIKMILLGLVFAVPLTLVVATLLMTADKGLEQMLNSVFRSIFSENIWIFFLRLIIAVPCACYLFGMIYSGAFQKGLSPCDDSRFEDSLSSAKCIHNVIFYTAVTPVCILYVLFFISQAGYFLSAFAGNLPEGYSYSTYARSGFFELLTVAVINLAVIVSINLFSRNSGKNKPGSLKAYSILLSVFTLILIATAASKMIMYISFYGLTRLRVYTTWFMILCAVVFVLIIIKQIRYDFRISHWVSCTFVIMFAVLCFSRPDALIAEYNIKMYSSGAIEELDTNKLLSMSDDAVLTALKHGAVTEEDIKEAREIRSKGNLNISYIILNNHLYSF
ncbi:MAG: DUF4153 domain-containing protein [Porcipelethomonas sp.]